MAGAHGAKDCEAGDCDWQHKEGNGDQYGEKTYWSGEQMVKPI